MSAAFNELYAFGSGFLFGFLYCAMFVYMLSKSNKREF